MLSGRLLYQKLGVISYSVGLKACRYYAVRLATKLTAYASATASRYKESSR